MSYGTVYLQIKISNLIDALFSLKAGGFTEGIAPQSITGERGELEVEENKKRIISNTFTENR